MNAMFRSVLCFAIVEFCLGLGKKSSVPSSLPWAGYPFKRPPKSFFPPVSEEDSYYYEAYDLGDLMDLDNLIDLETPSVKPDRKASSAFKMDVASSLHDFTCDLLSTMTANNTASNVAISPLSIYTALGMLTVGLGGNSKAQALTAMRGENLDDIHASMEKLSQSLFRADRRNVTLTKANRIFVDRSIQLKKTFKQRLRRDYHVSAKKVNFVRQPEANRRRINGFVQRHTNKKIRNLAPQGSITSDTRLFIANAMYLKAFWRTPFTDTTERRFVVSTAEVISTRTMTSMGPCSFITDDQLQATVVRNPLIGKISMIVIMPNSAGDFASLENSRGKAKVRQALEKVYEIDDNWMPFCQLSMPKFRIDYSAEKLVQSLNDMGMTDAFDPATSNLSQMTPHKDLFVSDFRHKACVEVNENGVEGSAATSVVAAQRMMPRPVPVDRPFVFLIRDDETGATLFAGKVVRPNAS